MSFNHVFLFIALFPQVSPQGRESKTHTVRPNSKSRLKKIRCINSNFKNQLFKHKLTESNEQISRFKFIVIYYFDDCGVFYSNHLMATQSRDDVT